MKKFRKFSILLFCILILGSMPVSGASDFAESDTSLESASNGSATETLSEEEIKEKYHVTQELLDRFNRPDAKLGLVTGASTEGIYRQVFPRAKLVYYNNVADMIYAASQGIVDGFCNDSPICNYFSHHVDGLEIFSEEFDPKSSYALAFSKSDFGQTLCSQFNRYLASIKADGSFQKLHDAWFNGTAESHIDYPKEGENGIIRLAVYSELPPAVTIENGEITGLEMQMASDFAKAYGYGLQIDDTNFNSLILSIASNRYDMACSSLTITEERKESVLFSDTYGTYGQLMLVPAESESVSIWEQISTSFERTFIRESRWKLILEGIKTTLIISVLSILFGSILGFAFCVLRLLGKKFVFNILTAYIRIMQGTPIVVILMIFYYIIFGNTSISGTVIAILGFTLNFAAYSCEIFRSGIDSIDDGQWEAALALGFTPFQTFFRIIIPQAARIFLPVYKGEVISTVKATSVVGYITVQDLTKMSDIIRSRTYEAFFPLITTAIVYFLLSWLLIFVLEVIERKLDFKNRSREPKGVKK